MGPFVVFFVLREAAIPTLDYRYEDCLVLTPIEFSSGLSCLETFQHLDPLRRSLQGPLTVITDAVQQSLLRPAPLFLWRCPTIVSGYVGFQSCDSPSQLAVSANQDQMTYDF